MRANSALISGSKNSCQHGANYQTANMIKEADPRVGFFSVLEVIISAKGMYRTATESGFKSHFPAAGTEQKLFEGGEKQNKHISLLSPGNRRNDHFSMDFYGYRVRRFGSLHGLYGDKNRKVGRASGSRFCSRKKRTEGTADVLASIAFGVPNALQGTPEPVCRHRRRKDYMEHRTRNIHVGTRLNNAEYEALKTLCNRTGLGSTRLLRKLITGTEIREKPTLELRDLQRSVDRIGNNLNQIAHRANAAGVLEKSEWDCAAALIALLREEIQTWR